jgi:hypothetical protein
MKDIEVVIRENVSDSRGGYRPQEVIALMRLAYETGRSVELSRALATLKEREREL